VKSISTNWPANPDPRRNFFRRAARASGCGRVVYAPRGETPAAGGFTLTEILIAIALIVIIGGLSAVDMNSVANNITHLSPAKVLQATIRQARYLAMLRMDNVVLTHDNSTRSFNLLDDKGDVLEQDPDGLDNPDANLTVTFTPIMALTDLVTDPSGQSDDDNNLSKIPSQRLVFHATGSTPPVKVTLSIDGNDTKFNLDPFSEGPPPKFPTIVPPLPSDTN
jgi:prepilin-type N-terminal cleavage/methylation domain-containing protein